MAAEQAVASILIADDGAGGAETWRPTLEWDGHNVRVENSGADAIEALRRDRFDVVVADMSTPQGGGLMVSGMARARTRPDNIIIVSKALGADIDGQVKQGFLREMGVKHILEKPVDANGLSLLVSRLTKKARA